MEQTLMDKLTILADSAKYDVACTSSGASRTARPGTVGSCYAPGCCHAFTADGRCVSLLKVLMTNCCSFDCGYCVNRRPNDIPRATFAPRELAELTMEFYRRNYIEGLFLSSAVLGTPDYTTERMLAVLRLLRGEYRFGGYIHAKAIPGTSPELLQQLGYLADRLSVNVELPSERSLNLLAPDKGRHSIFRPMKQIAVSGAASREELTLYRHAPKFAPAGQSTQMIVGASPETDYHILKLTEGMYHKYGLKRVFYSAYIPVAEDTRLPALDTKPPLLREHRLYQADWLLRFYQFEADEILDKDNPNFNPYLDPKCNWAVQHYGLFPVDVNRAPFEMLLRVPGIGPKSARRIWRARKQAALGLDELKRMGVVLKRAQYFITCRGFSGAHPGRGSAGRERITRALIDPNVFSGSCEQLSLFSPPAVDNPHRAGRAAPGGCPHGTGGGGAMSCQGAVNPKGARKLHDANVVYLYDGSFEGFLCCVYESFAQHELPFAVWTPQRETATLYPVKDIATDPAVARRVFASFGKKLGAETEYLVSRDFLSGQEDKELLLLRFLHLAFALGPGTVKREGHPVVAPLYAMKKSLDWEVDKFQGFVRFEEHDGMLGAVIHPKNYILPLLRPHFCGRFPEEDFMIYDAVHQAVLLHEGRSTRLLELAAPLELPPPSAREQQFQALWTQFYKTLEIKARHNEKGRMTHCPKRFWADMVEMKEELQ